MKSTREIILETAFELFLTKGYSVGVNEIIQKSNTSKGAFYHHFKSKEDLFIETIESNFFDSFANFNFENVKDRSYKTIIMDLVDSVFKPFGKISEKYATNGAVNFLSFISEYPKNATLLSKNREYYSMLNNMLLEILQNAIDKGEIKKGINVKSLSLHLIMVIDGAMFNSITMFENMKETEKECKKVIHQLLNLL